MTEILATAPISERGLELLRGEGWTVEQVSPKHADGLRWALATATAWILRSGTQVTAALREVEGVTAARLVEL